MNDCSCDSCGESICPGDAICRGCGAECDVDEMFGFVTKRTMDRGETKELEYALVDRLGAPMDVTLDGSAIWFTVKAYLSQADSQATWQGTYSAGIEQPQVGKVVVTIPPIATANVPDGIVKLYYDLRVRDSEGRVTTVEKGIFEVSPGVTRSY